MSDSRKRKGKQFYKGHTKKGRRNEELRPNLAGVLITCDGRERNAVAEAYRLLNEYADKKYGPERNINDDSDDSNEVDIEEALKKEVAEIKDTNKKGEDRRFKSIQNKAKNVIFIKTVEPVEPAELVSEIFNDILDSQERKSKFCLRCLPVINTCYAKVDEIVKAATVIIEKYFHNAPRSFTYCIMWKTRCNNIIKRDDVILKLVDIIHLKECGHETHYKNPEVILNLDIIGNICCFGILKNYEKFKKYNLDMLLRPSGVATADAKKDELGIKVKEGNDQDDDNSQGNKNQENGENQLNEVKTDIKVEMGRPIKKKDIVIENAENQSSIEKDELTDSVSDVVKTEIEA